MEHPIWFESQGLSLYGVLQLPCTERPPVVIGSHGLFADGNSPKQIALARACNTRGIAYFRFDHRGCGQSAGDFAQVTTVSGRSKDLEAAVRLLRSRKDLGPGLGFFGSSMGGAVALSVAARLQVQAIVTHAAPVHRSPLVDALEHSEDGRRLGPAFYQEQDAFRLPDGTEPLSRILVFHGENDAVVPVSHAHDLFGGAREPKRLVIFPGGDHAMSDPAHQARFVLESAAWFENFLCPKSS